MRPARSSLVLLAVLLANAAAPLFFRFFLSVDGPLHLMRASLSAWPGTTADHLAHGITYIRGSHGFVCDRVLEVLLLFLSPIQAHDGLAALVCGGLVLALVAYLRAHGTRPGLAMLWIAPVTFSVSVIMGLFNFILGIAVAFAAVAAWKGLKDAPRARWVVLLIGVAIAWYTHRGSLPLLAVLFLLTLAFAPRNPRPNPETIGRRTLAWRIALFAALGAAVILGAQRIGPLVRHVTEGIPPRLPEFRITSLLKPLYLFDRTDEAWLVIGIGVLLALSFAIGLWARGRMGRKVFWHDALLVLLPGLVLLSWIYGTPVAHKVLIAERCQWLILLVLVIWLTAIADAHRGWTAIVISGAALCALPLHIGRLVKAERHLAQLREVHAATVLASKALAPGSLVMPVVTDPEPVLQHMEAFVAIEHDGIVFSPDLHLSMDLPHELRTDAFWLYSEDQSWLMRYWRQGIPPEVDQVMFVGGGIERAVNKHPWPILLSECFRLSYDNGYARIYTAIRGE